MNWVERAIVKKLLKFSVYVAVKDTMPKRVLSPYNKGLQNVIDKMSSGESTAHNDAVIHDMRQEDFSFKDLNDLNFKKLPENNHLIFQNPSKNKLSNQFTARTYYLIRLLDLAIEADKVTPDQIPDKPLPLATLYALANSKKPELWPINLHVQRPTLFNTVKDEIKSLDRTLDIYLLSRAKILTKADSLERIGVEEFKDLSGLVSDGVEDQKPELSTRKSKHESNYSVDM